MSNISTNFSEEITIDRIVCPLHIITLKHGLDGIKHNQVLKVTTGGKNVSKELTSACSAMGHAVYSIEENNKVVLYVKKKNSTEFKYITVIPNILIQ